MPIPPAVLVSLALLLGACGGEPIEAGGPMRGISLELFVRTPDGRAMLYRIDPGGTLHFGGGLQAMNREFSWSGAMTESEIAELVDLIERDGWFAGPPVSSGTPSGLVSTVDLRGPRGHVRSEQEGTFPALERLRAVLDRVAERRLAPDLDRLPRPSIESGRER